MGDSGSTGVRGKGTVTTLDSLFSPEDTAKAARRVEEVAAERRRELTQLRHFAGENAALASLVQKLPDEISHQIMVPFGGAAFFPGRLIHTNELLVLLGEGYYAERTAKQTTEILHRRGKALDAQIDSLKASISDLEAEVQFFLSTASEASEGFVEIREEYIDENEEQVSGGTSSCNEKNGDKREKDEEHERIMARLDELEREELEAGSSTDDDNYNNDNDENNNEDEVEFVHSDLDDDDYAGGNEEEETIVRDEHASKFKDLNDNNKKSGIKEVSDSQMQAQKKAVSFKITEEQVENQQKPPVLPVEPKYSILKDTAERETKQTTNIGSSSRRAFTGSIVEHDHTIVPAGPTKSTVSEKASSSTNPSKPVSRFKLQKGGAGR